MTNDISSLIKAWFPEKGGEQLRPKWVSGKLTISLDKDTGLMKAEGWFWLGRRPIHVHAYGRKTERALDNLVIAAEDKYRTIMGDNAVHIPPIGDAPPLDQEDLEF